VWPSPRFHDNGNGSVTDNLTGLTWLQNAFCTDTVGGIENTGFLLWSDALAWSNALASGACGLSDSSLAGDWRLPNREELESLIDFGSHTPALLPGYPFNSVQGTYWTSTSSGSDPTSAWTVDAGDGFMSYFGKASLVSAWPVRGTSGPTGDLTITKIGTGSGTVRSSPAGISCDAPVALCPTAFFPLGSAVSLSAIPPVGGVVFSGWSGDPDCSDGRVTMVGSVACTAAFDLCAGSPAQIGATQYASIASAYGGAAVSGDTIQLIAANLPEVLDFSSGKSVALQGGFDCAFGVPVSYTVLSGSLTVSTGEVTISNVTII